MRNNLEDSRSPDDASVFEHENAFIEGFVIRIHRPRLQFLLGEPKRRYEFVQALVNSKKVDPRYIHAIPPGEQKVEMIVETLTRTGASPHCYAISENERIDGRLILVTDALAAVLGWEAATILSCIPGRLAYLEEEGKNCRYLVTRTSGATAPKE